MKDEQEMCLRRRVGRNLKSERNKRGMSLREVASGSGISSATICRMERGTTGSKKAIEAIAKLFGEPLETFYRDDYVETELVKRVMTPNQRKLHELTADRGEEVTELCLQIIEMVTRMRNELTTSSQGGVNETN